MARSRYKAGGATAGRFKPKKMGKGYASNRKEPIGSRPVLRITEPVDGDQEKGSKADQAETKSED
ncbi:MAG: hypothetical protein KAI24_18610 [Planctomycetes bacterium]|nr:hypothetical protein [Planctomycetota bacterium]